MVKMDEVLSVSEISKRVKELGADITRDYQGKKLCVIAVLNGAFIFCADLVRAIDLDLQVDFVRVGSYGQGSKSSGVIHLSKDVDLEINDKDILLVEDIVDSGKTLAWLQKFFQKKNCKSVKICALIDKRERREEQVFVDYYGFKVEQGFLVGYGLDYAEKFRSLGNINHLIIPH